jgi:hypothetical protein
MKELIKDIQFVEEYTNKFGTYYKHKIFYADTWGFYSSKKKEQTFFEVGKEAEFDVEEQTYQGNTTNKLKLQRQGQFSGYNRNLKKEQSRYSGFSASYVKDMLINGILEIETDLYKNVDEPSREQLNNAIMFTWRKRSKEIFDHLVKLDKSIENDSA